MKTKKEIRDIVRQQRRDYTEVKESSAIICDKIMSLPEFQSAGTVLSYSPMKGEVDVRLLLEQGKKIILPEDDPFPDSGEIDFAVIPGVAFTADGDRLGRGGGFYDRLIPKLECPTVGVAFSFQIYDEIPMDEWDMPVSMVITESD